MSMDFDVYARIVANNFPRDAYVALNNLDFLERRGRLNIPPLYNTFVGLTSGNFDGHTVGIAFVGTNREDKMYAVVQDIFGSGLTGNLLGHELGHTRGLSHIGGNAESIMCNIMYPSIGSSSRCSSITSNPLKAYIHDSQKEELGWLESASISRDCSTSIPPGVIVLRISSPIRGQVLTRDSVDIRGIAKGLVFENCGRVDCDKYILSYKPGLITRVEPGFTRIIQDIADKDSIENLGTWNIDSLSNGWYTIRLQVIYHEDDGTARAVTTFKHVKIDRSGVTQRAIIEGFVRGDANGDEIIDITDGIEILAYLFKGGEAPSCHDGADADDDGKITLTDAVKILNHLFQGGSIMPAPYPETGIDLNPDQLPECR